MPLLLPMQPDVPVCCCPLPASLAVLRLLLLLLPSFHLTLYACMHQKQQILSQVPLLQTHPQPLPCLLSLLPSLLLDGAACGSRARRNDGCPHRRERACTGSRLSFTAARGAPRWRQLGCAAGKPRERLREGVEVEV